MTHVTCRLTAKNRNQLRDTTLDYRVWATFTFTQQQQSTYAIEGIRDYDHPNYGSMSWVRLPFPQVNLTRKWDFSVDTRNVKRLGFSAVFSYCW